MAEQERVVLNPAEFMPTSVEVPLDDLGLGLSERVEGTDWGEAAIQAQMVAEDEGESSSNGHRPGVPIRIPIRVHEDESTGVSLAEAAHTLQSVVGRWQDEGGWIRRDFADAGGFSGSLAYRIYRHTAHLSGMQGWLWAHRQDAPDVVLTATRHPIGYALVEVSSEEFTEESARALKFKLAHIAGTAPGRIRILVKNLGEEPWRALIFAGESRDHPQDETAETTAAQEYMAADLTLKGGAKDIGAGVVEHDSLTAGWLTVLNSKIDGIGHMTHLGVRRLWLGVEQVGGEHGDVQLRARWRPLGQIRWEELEMPIVPPPVVDAYQLLDMGEFRPEPPALGGNRWEFEIRMRAVSGSGKARIKEVFPLPTEFFAVVSSPDGIQGADEQEQKTPETAENDGGGAPGADQWKDLSNAKVSDGKYATVKLTAVEPPLSVGSEFAVFKGFGFEIPPEATILGILPEIECKASGGSIRALLVSPLKGGFPTGPGEGELGGQLESDVSNWGGADEIRIYGQKSGFLWGLPWTPGDVNDDEGFGVRFAVIGDAGATAHANRVGILVSFTEATDESRVCFAGRSLEIRSDGIYRQHPEDDVWGRLVEEGFLPIAPPSGLEGREFRGIIIPSQGDLGELADVGTNQLSAQTHVRAGYQLATEAAS